VADASTTAALLVRASRSFPVQGWIFTGFNWPVLAARVARQLGRTDFVQVIEGGAALDKDTDRVMTSTTDYAAIYPATCYRGSTADVLYSLVPRCDLVVMDGANADLLGRANSTAVGDRDRPRVRLPGGGGGPDAAWGARSLLLLHGGTDLRRITAQVENVTSAPHPEASVRLLTRWGSVRLGAEPRLESVAAEVDTSEFRERLRSLGADVTEAGADPAPADEELGVAEKVLAEAAAAGYRIQR
jgi:glutaconate CoA-transferase, subunit B